LVDWLLEFGVYIEFGYLLSSVINCHGLNSVSIYPPDYYDASIEIFVLPQN
jgi:hypothetical protein